MSESKISCPHCAQHIVVDEAWAAQTINCPVCQKPFVVPGTPPMAQVITPAAPPAPGLRIGNAAEVPPPMAPRGAAGAAPQPAPTATRTSGLAIASLVLSLLGCFFITAIAGVICGHMARERIRNNRNLSGGALAAAGLIIGYLFIGLNVAYVVRLAPQIRERMRQLEARRSGRIYIPPSGSAGAGSRKIDTNPIIKSTVPVPEGAVAGKIQGQDFVYTRSSVNKFMSMLTIQQGEHFRADQEIKVMGLGRSGESLANRSWNITAATPGAKPTIWLTWMQNGQPRTDAATQGYSLQIKTDPETNGVITGTFNLFYSGRTAGVSVKGNFAAKVE